MCKGKGGGGGGQNIALSNIHFSFDVLYIQYNKEFAQTLHLMLPELFFKYKGLYYLALPYYVRSTLSKKTLHFETSTHLGVE